MVALLRPVTSAVRPLFARMTEAQQAHVLGAIAGACAAAGGTALSGGIH